MSQPEDFASIFGSEPEGDGPSSGAFDDLLEDMGGSSFISVSKLIDQSIRNEQTSRRMDGFHPSFIAGRKCLNAYYKSVTQDMPQEHFSPRTLRIFANGEDVHKRLQRIMKPHLLGTWQCRNCHTVHNEHHVYVEWLRHRAEHGDFSAKAELQFIADNASLEPEPCPEKCVNCEYDSFKYLEWRVIDTRYNVTGKIDGVIRIDGNDYGWEIKSANKRSFDSASYIQKYKSQFALYLHLLGLTRGIITIECKDNQELKDIQVTTDSIDIGDELQLMLTVNRIRRGEQELPPPVFNTECKDCPFYGKSCSPASNEKNT